MSRSTTRKLIHVFAVVSIVSLLVGGGLATADKRTDRPPVVFSGTAIEVQGTSVVLQGAINPGGQTTSYYYQVGTTPLYGIGEPNERLLRTDRNEEVLEAIPGLRRRTTYHFRLVAHNRSGTTYGKDKTFRTLGPAAP